MKEVKDRKERSVPREARDRRFERRRDGQRYCNQRALGRRVWVLLLFFRAGIVACENDHSLFADGRLRFL